MLNTHRKSRFLFSFCDTKHGRKKSKIQKFKLKKKEKEINQSAVSDEFKLDKENCKLNQKEYF